MAENFNEMSSFYDNALNHVTELAFISSLHSATKARDFFLVTAFKK